MIEEKINCIQNIFLENRKKLNVSGVNDVLSFDDKMVIVETELRAFNNKRGQHQNNKIKYRYFRNCN